MFINLEGKKMRILKIGLMTVSAFAIILQFGSFLGNPPSAQTVWVKGTVTKAPWSDRHNRIGINGITYTFMPEIGISFPNQSRPKVSGGERASLVQKIPVRRMVQFRAQGHRIYEIILEK